MINDAIGVSLVFEAGYAADTGSVGGIDPLIICGCDIAPFAFTDGLCPGPGGGHEGVAGGLVLEFDEGIGFGVPLILTLSGA